MGNEDTDSEVTVIGRNPILKEKSANDRKQERFYLLEEETWNLKINQHVIFPSAIQNIHSGGMLVLVSRDQGSLRGKIVPLTLKLEGKNLIVGTATVRWSKIHPVDRTKMYMGLQFEDVDQTIAKKWRDYGVKRHLSRQKPQREPDVELIEPGSWSRNVR